MAKNDYKYRLGLQDDVSPGLKKIEANLGGLGASFKKVAGAAGAIGSTISGVAGVAAITSLALETVNLEQAIARAGQATGATRDQLQALEDAAQAAGEALGASAVDGATALTALGKAGFDAQDAIGALPNTLALAKTENIGFAEAAGLAADTLDLFGLNGSQAAQTIDVLAAAASGAGTSVTQLQQGLTQVGPTARNAGLDLQETAAALGVLAQNGIEGGKSGKALKGILEQLSKPASAFSQELSKLGISSRDFSTVLEQLQGRGAKAEGAIKALGGNGSNALRALLAEGGGALDELAQKIANSEGSAARAADTINNTFLGRLTQLRTAIGSIFDDLFGPALEPLTTALEDLRTAANEFAQSDDFAVIQQNIKEAFESGVKDVTDFLKTFDFKEASKNLTQFTSDAKEALSGLSTVLSTISASLKFSIETIQGGLSSADGIASAIAARFAEAFAKITDGFSGVSDSAKQVTEGLQQFADTTGARVEPAIRKTVNSAQELLGAFGLVDEQAKASAESQDKLAGATKKNADEQRALENALKLGAAAGTEAAAKTEAATQKQVQAVDALAVARAKLAGLEVDLAKAFAAGDVEAVARLKNEIAAATAEVEKLSATAEGAGTTVAKSFGDAAGSAEALANSTAQAAESVATAGTSANQSAQAAGQALGGIADLLTGLFTKYAQVSVGAAQFFREAQQSANRTSTSLEDWGRSIEQADQRTAQAVERARLYGDEAIERFKTLADTGDIAGAQIGNSLGEAEAQLASIAQQAKDATDEFALMDSQTLGRLQSALDAARTRVANLKAEAAGAIDQLASLNRQLAVDLAAAQGDETARLRADLERKLADVDALEKKAGAAGAAAANEARARLQQQYQLELAQIEERKRQDQQAAKDAADARIRENQRANAAIDADNQARTATQAGGGGLPTPTAGAGGLPVRRESTQNVSINVSTLLADQRGVETIIRQLLPEFRRQLARAG